MRQRTMLDRHDFFGALGIGTIAVPVAAESQHACKVARVGVLVPSAAGPSPLLAAFQEGLRELGHVEKQSVDLVMNLARPEESITDTLAARSARRFAVVRTGWWC